MALEKVSRRDWIIASVVLLLGCIAMYLFFAKLYDTSEFEAKAQTLIGQPASAVTGTLGVPTQIKSAKEFNDRSRADVIVSYRPDEVPFAEGRVYFYNKMPTIVLLYEKDGKIVKMYVGKS